ncbi:hypothetical protein AVEN_111465-1 [Araneus ventricosus]|uniref:CCHC-type domain-containing protein n=1 Tax=Araneus ventricosus TaxID=182803 RepID=A0A4Y2K1M5_ARAVE|nr:hypothetical protein AVEN_111465-1 [Araneus ventricosus]
MPDSVRAGYIKLTVRPSIPNPLRCYKCQRFGHSRTSCRGILTCARCAEAGHDSSDCKASEKCVNCKGSHTSFSRLCSAWKFEKEVIAEKVKEKIFRFSKPDDLLSLAHQPLEPAMLVQSIDPVLKLTSTDTRNETVSFQFKVPKSNKNPPDFSDLKTVTHKKKFKKDSLVNQDNITVDKVFQYYKPPQFTDKEPCEASNSVIKQNNIPVINSGTKSPYVSSVCSVPVSMVAFPPEKTKVLQYPESDADVQMSSSSASEGDTLEYDMSEDHEDTPQNICPTTLLLPCTARKR